jgi:hypothetical protein
LKNALLHVKFSKQGHNPRNLKTPPPFKEKGEEGA